MTWLSTGPCLAGLLTMLACVATGWELHARQVVPVPACAAAPARSAMRPPDSGAEAMQDGSSWQRWPRTTDF